MALPAYLAARGGRRHRRVPVVVHEANASAGIANKIGARLAARVLAAVPDSGLQRGRGDRHPGARGRSPTWTGPRCAPQARAHFGLPDDAPVLLVFGGSQGARTLNEAVSGGGGASWRGAASRCCTRTARRTPSSCLRPGAGRPPYVAVPYLYRMDLAYAAADAAVCRSGAMTVAEVSAVGLPAVYVPLPHGNGEQELNALPVVDAGGGLMVADAELTPEYVADVVVPLLTDPARLAAMTAAAAQGRAPRRRRSGWRGSCIGRRTASSRRVTVRRCPRSCAGCTWSASAAPACRGIARILLARGALVSGSDAKESRGVLALRARGAQVADRARRVGARPAAGRPDRGGHHPRGHPEDQPRTGRGAPARHPGAACGPVVLAALMGGHRTLLVSGTHGKTSTTSMLDRRAAALRVRPVVRGRRRAQRGGHQRPPRHRRHLRGRGRRERRLAAAVRPGRRGRHQYRGRPPRLLRHRRGLRRRCSTSSSTGSRPAGRWWSARRSRRGRLAQRWPSPRGVRVLGYVSARPGDDRLAAGWWRWQPQGAGAVAEFQLAGETASADAAAVGAGPAHGAQRAGRAAGRARRRCARRPSWTGWPDSVACTGGFSSSDRRTGSGSSTTTPTIPTEVRAVLGAAARTLPGSPRPACRPGRSWCSSRTCTRAPRRSPRNSVPRWTWPTRWSCSTSTARGRSRCPGSAARVAERSRAGALPAGFSAGRATGRRGRAARRRGDHHGRGRRDDARPGDPDRLRVHADRNAPGRPGAPR